MCTKEYFQFNIFNILNVMIVRNILNNWKWNSTEFDLGVPTIFALSIYEIIPHLPARADAIHENLLYGLSQICVTYFSGIGRLALNFFIYFYFATAK